MGLLLLFKEIVTLTLIYSRVVPFRTGFKWEKRKDTGFKWEKGKDTGFKWEKEKDTCKTPTEH